MSKTEMLRELVFQHSPAEVKEKLRSIEKLEERINSLKTERRRAMKDLISPKSEEPLALSNRNGHAVPF